MQYFQSTELNPSCRSHFFQVSWWRRFRCSSRLFRLFEYHSEKPLRSRNLANREGKRNRRKLVEGTVKTRNPSSLKTRDASRRTCETSGMCSSTLFEITVPKL